MLQPHIPSSIGSLYSAFDVVAMTASAGGREAVTRVCAALPPDFPAAIVLVQHLARQRQSTFVELLSQRTQLPVYWGYEGATLNGGTIVVAPPDYHLLVTTVNTLTLSQAPPINHVRPSADPLFTSVALRFQERALGVVLTGTSSDGALGTTMLKRMGGRVLVQDPASAAYVGMPDAAIATGCVDFVLPLAQIAPALIALVMAPTAAALFRVGAAFSRAHVHRSCWHPGWVQHPPTQRDV